MTTSLTPDLARPLALELYALLREISPSSWGAEIRSSVYQRLQRIQTELSRLRSQLEVAIDGRRERLRRCLVDLGTVVDGLLSDAELPLNRRAFRRRLQRLYLRLADALRAEDIHVPSLRPSNLKRSLFHATSGLVALATVQLAPAFWLILLLAGALASYAWTMELLRRRDPRFNERIMAFYGPLAHPHEWHRVNSATWYCSALLLLSLSGSTLVCSLAVIVLGLADPAASFVGRRWGSIRLIHGRSLQGTSAFALVGFAAALLVMTFFFRDLPLADALWLAGAAGLSGAGAELLSRRIDDNFSVPIAVGLATAITRALL